MKFGFVFWLDRDFKTVVENAKVAERSGFEFLWFPDHYFLRDTTVVQTLVAVNTSRVKLGTAVASPYLRHPAALASTVASLDEVSGGRTVFGVGSGGAEFPKNLSIDTSKALAACREAIHVVRELWTARPVNYSGSVFSLRNAKIAYASRTNIPIYLAARGKNMFKLAGEVADGVITHGVTDDYLKFAIENLKVGAEKAGRRIEDIDFGLYAPLIATDKPEEVKRQLKSDCILFAGGEYSERLIPLYGLTLEEVKPLKQVVSQGNLAKAAEMVTEKMVDSFCIVGTPDQCIDRLRELRKFGVTQIMTRVSKPVEQIGMSKYIEKTGADLVGQM